MTDGEGYLRDKLDIANAPVSAGGAARRPLKSLTGVRGYVVLEFDPEGRPLLVAIRPMIETTLWRREGGDKRGPGAIYVAAGVSPRV